MSQPEHVLVVGAGLGGLRTVEQLRTRGLPGPDQPRRRRAARPVRPAAAVEAGAHGRMGARAHDAALRGGPRRARACAPISACARWRCGRARWSSPTGRRCTRTRSWSPPGWPPARCPGSPRACTRCARSTTRWPCARRWSARARCWSIGGGFIGAEVASSARTRGLAVTVLEALPVPSARALGEELGALTGRLMTEAGVDLRTDVRIAGFVDGSGRTARRRRRRSGWRWRTGRG